MQTVIINNRENMDTYQMQPIGKDSRGMAILGPIVVLLPGANLVDSAKVDALLNNPGFKMKFENTIPRTPAPEQNPEKAGKPFLEYLQVETKDGKRPLQVEDKAPLAKLKPEVARVLIAETLIPSTLRRWHDEEGRPEVRTEISKQLIEIGQRPAGMGSDR